MDALKIGRQISALRRERGLTQEGLAELLQISPQAVSKWENGRALPETALLVGLARALDTSIDALLTENGLQVLAAWYGDGMECARVEGRLNRLIEGDVLDVQAGAAALGCVLGFDRPKYLTVKYRTAQGVFYAFACEGERLTLRADETGSTAADGAAQIIAASYGTGTSRYDVMHKLAHYRLFNWDAYPANHEVFPSDPASDGTDYLTFVYLSADGIHMVTCAEGESIARTGDGRGFVRRESGGAHLIPGVPALPPFGGGQECSWGAALTAALQAMHIKTDYTQVMGVSGACYRLAFCSPGWDYSAVDGLVAYDYATPGYAAFGFTVRLVSRIERERRAQERARILAQLDCNMPVLGINLRVAAEWGVICGYKNRGADLLCRTKYDAQVIEGPDFQPGAINPYDYLYVDNWPFILAYFEGRTPLPGERENLLASLRVFADCAQQERAGGYSVGFRAYEVWCADLLDDGWYEAADDGQLARRFSVNQFCTLALWDARRAAHAYLQAAAGLLPGQEAQMTRMTELFGEIAKQAEQIHRMLDAGEYLEGARARRFWSGEMRRSQAALLSRMLASEREALRLAGEVLAGAV